MMNFTFRSVVDSVRRGETDQFATNMAAKQGDLFLLVSARHYGPHNIVEQQPDENPIRAVVEISKVEDGPSPFRHFVRWNRLVFGEATPIYHAEIAFDHAGHPRYSRLVAVHKRLDETQRSVVVIDLEDGEVLTTDFDRLMKANQLAGGVATADSA
jgi:hypothetical protein